MTSAAKAERRKHGYRGVLATCVAGLLIFAIVLHQILLAILIAVVVVAVLVLVLRVRSGSGMPPAGGSRRGAAAGIRGGLAGGMSAVSPAPPGS